MGWTVIFRDILQPILFVVLFCMTFISMLIGMRAARQDRKKGRIAILHPETERFMKVNVSDTRGRKSRPTEDYHLLPR